MAGSTETSFELPVALYSKFDAVCVQLRHALTYRSYKSLIFDANLALWSLLRHELQRPTDDQHSLSTALGLALSQRIEDKERFFSQAFLSTAKQFYGFIETLRREPTLLPGLSPDQKQFLVDMQLIYTALLSQHQTEYSNQRSTLDLDYLQAHRWQWMDQVHRVTFSQLHRQLASVLTKPVLTPATEVSLQRITSFLTAYFQQAVQRHGYDAHTAFGALQTLHSPEWVTLSQAQQQMLTSIYRDLDQGETTLDTEILGHLLDAQPSTQASAETTDTLPDTISNQTVLTTLLLQPGVSNLAMINTLFQRCETDQLKHTLFEHTLNQDNHLLAESQLDEARQTYTKANTILSWLADCLMTIYKHSYQAGKTEAFARFIPVIADSFHHTEHGIETIFALIETADKLNLLSEDLPPAYLDLLQQVPGLEHIDRSDSTVVMPALQGFKQSLAFHFLRLNMHADLQYDQLLDLIAACPDQQTHLTLPEKTIWKQLDTDQKQPFQSAVIDAFVRNIPYLATQSLFPSGIRHEEIFRWHSHNTWFAQSLTRATEQVLDQHRYFQPSAEATTSSGQTIRADLEQQITAPPPILSPTS